MLEFLKINASHGEGGGQIVRSAITLSCITKKPIHLENIRKNRKLPGLRPQHLTAITILQEMTDAKVVGAEIGSTELKFIPGEVKEGDFIGDIKTAGSISLILQVVIPVISLSHKKINLTIKGGTDVLWSPSFDYTENVVKKAYERMGIRFVIEKIKTGYYPKGGGEVKVKISPTDNIKAITLTERKTNVATILCTFTKISENKILDKIKNIKKILNEKKFSVDTKIKNQDAIDAGASLLVFSVDEKSIIGVDSLFDKKIQTFDINMDEFTRNELGLDKNLADMLVIPASLAKGKTILRVKEITKHLETNLFVTSKITGCRYGIGKLKEGFEVIIEGISNSGIKQ